MPVKKMNTCLSPFRRIEFPIFDGNQSRDCIRDCEEYFQTLSTSENHKVILALIYMQGRAKIWGQVYEENMINPTWSKFVAQILEEFDNFRPEVVSLERVSCQPLSENATVEGTGENVEPQLFDKMLELAALSKEDFETTKGDGEAIEIQVFDKMLGKQLKKVNVNHGRELMKGVTASMLDVHGGKSLEKYDIPLIKEVNTTFAMHIKGCPLPLYCKMMSPGLDWWKSDSPDSLRQNASELQTIPSNMIDISSEIVGITAKKSTNNKKKVLKAFKFALVEFLKNLLKPYWKRREIRYEVHKEILKKAAVKIIESLGDSNIPREQQEIGNCLSDSESKMSKLIQENWNIIRHTSLDIDFMACIEKFAIVNVAPHFDSVR